jgi:adenylate kinase family enzyme
MKRVAVFGNTGGGKSTLAKRMSELTGLPLFAIDTFQYRAGGGQISPEEYAAIHADIVARDRWIIDGYGDSASSWERFAAADTLVFVDMSVVTHGRWVGKRLIQGLFVNPEGWPENSPIWRSTLNSVTVLWRYRQRLTPMYRQYVAEATSSKQVHHLRSPRDIRAFLFTVGQQHGEL